MDATESINAIEDALRSAITAILGDRWIEQDPDLRDALEARRIEESKRRDGARVDHHLLAYSHIYELRKLVSKNWDEFKAVFKDKKHFDVYMDRVEDLRNVPMHSRQLLPFEQHLLSGIAGEIRNLVTIYRSQLAPDGKHYPVVESIIDSFGNQLVKNFRGADGTRLKMGDIVEFQCRGWDPQDRPLTWTLERVGRGEVSSATGNSVVLAWTVTEADISEFTQLAITMNSNGKYHRYPYGDQSETFIYRVDPPMG